MDSKTRVMAAIRRRTTDRVPRGELGIEEGFIRNFLPPDEYEKLSPMARGLRVRELLHMDLVNIHEFPKTFLRYDADGFPVFRSGFGDIYKDMQHSFVNIEPAIHSMDEVFSYSPADISMCTTHELEYYRDYSDLFLMAQIDGPVGALGWALGMENYMCLCMTDTAKIAAMAEKVMDFEIVRAIRFIEEGAHAIMMADDIAFNTGLLVSPKLLEVVAYPYYKKSIEQIKHFKDVPVFMHSDGDMRSVIPQIIECGFDGLQSIQPSAGMDIAGIKREFGKDLCLMGNVDLNQLLPFGTPEEVEREVTELIEVAGEGGGFILSTCNILTDSVKPENAVAMYGVGL
ncbi:MAG: hypothetical protein LBJ91_03055 [Clostridiales Family XIII bacterium]|jgi:uroporphyrinogen decarboxylase|nr:hypothetical protein [Clostridiales Family XIII bacterium]